MKSFLPNINFSYSNFKLSSMLAPEYQTYFMSRCLSLQVLVDHCGGNRGVEWVWKGSISESVQIGYSNRFPGVLMHVGRWVFLQVVRVFLSSSDSERNHGNLFLTQYGLMCNIAYIYEKGDRTGDFYILSQLNWWWKSFFLCKFSVIVLFLIFSVY